jgi:hypothetical protein
MEPVTLRQALDVRYAFPSPAPLIGLILQLRSLSGVYTHFVVLFFFFRRQRLSPRSDFFVVFKMCYCD